MPEFKPPAPPLPPGRAERKKFYDSARWVKCRDLKRAISPMCERCERAGVLVPVEHVDHIQPLADRPDLALDLDNLQSLCASCHSVKTAQEKRERRG